MQLPNTGEHKFNHLFTPQACLVTRQGHTIVYQTAALCLPVYFPHLIDS